MDLMDNSNFTSKLLIQLLSTNIQMNALVLNTHQNPEVRKQGILTISNLIKWLKNEQGNSDFDNECHQIVTLAIEKLKEFGLVFETQTMNNKIIEQKTESSPSLQIKDVDQGNLDLVDSDSNNVTVDITEKVISQVTPDNSITEKQIEKDFLSLTDDPNDQWHYLDNIQTFMNSYEHLMHFLLPNIFYEASVELHKITSDNKNSLHEIIAYPTNQMKTVINKFLREAPGANLFRRIRRTSRESGIDVELEQQLTIIEKHGIKKLIIEYTDLMTSYLDPEIKIPPNIETLKSNVQLSFKQFSLGPITVEARITAVVKNVVEVCYNESISFYTDDSISYEKKVISFGSVLLLCKLQIYLLSEKRFLKFLEQLKR